jgi:alpha-beta hydrolase superfamily lysophospholipase
VIRGRRLGGAGSERVAGRSRLALATLVSAVTFVAAGVASGLLIDEYGGVLGALEWLLRTLVVIAAVVFIVAGAVLVLRVRRRVRSRPLGWLLAVVAFLAFVWLAAVPVGYSVYLTHLPSRDSVADADLGARKEAVTLSGADGVRLRGWYVPSRNRAAVIALHGTGSSRLGVAGHARMLARHGYGVLALDLRGHGESDGRSTSAPWKNDEDMDAAVEWLTARADVDPARVGMLGVSHGAEVSLRTAARRNNVRAVVAEGAMGSPADARAAGASVPVLAQLGALFGLSILLTGETATPDAEFVERIAPRPLLLISAGRTTEANANRDFQRRAGASAEHWNLADAPHAAALRTAPAEYERRVIGFLDRALR